MSYDLFLKSEVGPVDLDQVRAFLASRDHFTVNEGQAAYENADTGVYFFFYFNRGDDAEEDAEAPIAFNMNYYRPSFFPLEAEPELAGLVGAFGLTVQDPQIDGMGEGPFSSELFLRGWNAGNKVAHSSIHAAGGVPPKVLPASRLLDVWEWNRQRRARQAEVGEGIFVPKIMFLEVDGRLGTYAVWPDGLPIWTPVVDNFLVTRHDLAPRTLFGKLMPEDRVMIAWKDAEPYLRRHGVAAANNSLRTNYSNVPSDIAAFIKARKVGLPSLAGVAAGSVLDEELVGGTQNQTDGS